MPTPRVVELAATRDRGLDPWLAWLEALHAARPAAPRPLATSDGGVDARAPRLRLGGPGGHDKTV